MTEKANKQRPSRPMLENRHRLASWGLACLIALAGCAQERIRDNAQSLLRQGQYEEALRSVEAGLQEYPESALLRSQLIEARQEAANRMVMAAASAKSKGRLDEAEQILQRALALQPGDRRAATALQDITVERRQRQALVTAAELHAGGRLDAAAKLIREALKDDPRQADLLALQRRVEADQRQADLAVSQKGLAETRTISLDFREANLRTVLDVVSRNSGINFILDKDIRPDTRVTVFLRSARVEDAIDLITSTYQLSKKVIDSQTLLIYPNTAEKQREHQEQVVKVFHLAHAEAKAAGAFLKGIARIKEPYVDERNNMVIVRDSQEAVQLAERMITLFDTPEPEVLLEVEVIEIRTSRLTELGVKLPTSVGLTVLPPAGQQGLSLATIERLSRDGIGVSVGGTTLNLRREAGDYDVLASPSVRVRNREKAKIMIGDKLPLVTTTTGTGGFVSDSITYLDVGLKLEVEPTVYVDDEVAIRVALEVSSQGSAVKTASGSLAYQIGTRNANTLLRLRDNETQLLAGLISKEERSDANRVPGLGDLPVAGRLFSSTLDESKRTELVLSITPRILRNVQRLDAAQSEVWVGTETTPRIRPTGGVLRKPAEASVTSGRAADAATGAGPVGGGGSPASGARKQAGPRPAAPSASDVALADPGPTEGTTTPSTAGIGVSTGPRLRWQAPDSMAKGDVVDVVLLIDAAQPLRGMPLGVGFDPNALQLLDVTEGDFFKQDGAATSMSKRSDPEAESLELGIIRSPASGVSGQGSVVTLRFKALREGATLLRLKRATPMNAAATAAATVAVGPTGAPLPVIHRMVIR